MLLKNNKNQDGGNEKIAVLNQEINRLNTIVCNNLYIGRLVT